MCFYIVYLYVYVFFKFMYVKEYIYIFFKFMNYLNILSMLFKYMLEFFLIMFMLYLDNIFDVYVYCSLFCKKKKKFYIFVMYM